MTCCPRRTEKQALQSFERERERKKKSPPAKNSLLTLIKSRRVGGRRDPGRDASAPIRCSFSCFYERGKHFRSSANVLTRCGLISAAQRAHALRAHTPHRLDPATTERRRQNIVGSRHQSFPRGSAVRCAQPTWFCRVEH